LPQFGLEIGPVEELIQHIDDQRLADQADGALGVLGGGLREQAEAAPVDKRPR
jgi:hypothetical protein